MHHTRTLMKIWLAIGVLFISALPLGAADVEENYPFAKLAMPELLIGVGTRSTAMGGMGAAITQDLTSLYWNPAGLGRVPNFTMDMIHNSWLQQISQETLLIGLPVGETFLAAGINYFSLGTADMTTVDDIGNVRLENKELNLNMLSGMAGIAFEFAPAVLAGMTAKYASQNLGTKTLSTAGFDLGVQYVGMDDFNLGAALSNLGMGVGRFSLPATLRLGVALDQELFEKNFLIAGLDLEMPLGAMAQGLYHFGVEYSYDNVVAVRAGYQFGDIVGLTMGAGLRLGGWTFGYAYAPQGELGDTHRISLSIDFFELTKPQPKKKAKAQSAPSQPDPRKSRMAFGVVEAPPSGDVPTSPLVSEDEAMMRSLLDQKIQVQPQIKKVRGQEVYKVDFKLARGDSTRLSSWTMTLLDRAGKPLRSYRGGDKLPQVLRWDGRNQKGAAVEEIKTVRYQLKLTDVNGNVEVAQGPVWAVAAKSKAAGQESTDSESGPETRVFGPVLFDMNRAEITPGGAEVIKEAAQFLRQYPQSKIYVDGHSDGDDEGADALMLSKARAEAVARYLSAYHKVPISRILIKARGDRDPAVPGAKDSQRFKNRRVMITITIRR